jgi:hypothetical protein
MGRAPVEAQGSGSAGLSPITVQASWGHGAQSASLASRRLAYQFDCVYLLLGLCDTLPRGCGRGQAWLAPNIDVVWPDRPALRQALAK